MRFVPQNFILILLAPLAFAQSTQLKQLRDAYYQAADSSAAAQVFYEQMETVDDSSEAILIGYKGMASFMLSHHAGNPATKLRHFRQGRELLEHALERDPKNLELRFLRFTVQASAPEFLGYQRTILDDKQFILRALNKSEKIDPDLRSRMIKFLRQSKYCSSRERKQLQEIAKNLRPLEK